MLAKIEYIPLYEQNEIKLDYYYHPLFGLVSLTYIDWNSNRSNAKIISSGQTTYVNNDDLYKLVATTFPLQINDLNKNDEFYYYQLNQQYPKLDYVYKRDNLGVVGRNSRMLIPWDNVFKVMGDIDREDYADVFNKQYFHNQVEVGILPETNEYFILPNKDEFVYLHGIKFEEYKIKKALFKQGFNLTKIDATV